MTDDALTGLTTAFFGPTTSTHGPRHSDEIDLERQQLEYTLETLSRELKDARAEAVLAYASQKDALVGGPHEGAHRANAVAYVKAQGWLTQEPKEGQ